MTISMVEFQFTLRNLLLFSIQPFFLLRNLVLPSCSPPNWAQFSFTVDLMLGMLGSATLPQVSAITRHLKEFLYNQE